MMCVAAGPAAFAETIVYAGEARRNDHIVHVAGYQNVAQSKVRPPAERRRWRDWITGGSDRAQTANALILHFPAQPGSMSQDNVVDTERCPKLLEDMVSAVRVPVVSAAPGAKSRRRTTKVEVFESGIYTVVLASDARAIVGALDRVPPRKRPPLNKTLFDWYHATFPAWPVALCCFDNTDRRRATPMLWWYEPLVGDVLFAPAIDAHTGDVPDLDARVAVDHWVVAGSSEMAPGRGNPVRYRDPLVGQVADFAPAHVVGRFFGGSLPNADFVIPVSGVRAGDAEVERRLLTL